MSKWVLASEKPWASYGFSHLEDGLLLTLRLVGRSGSQHPLGGNLSEHLCVLPAFQRAGPHIENQHRAEALQAPMLLDMNVIGKTGFAAELYFPLTALYIVEKMGFKSIYLFQCYTNEKPFSQVFIHFVAFLHTFLDTLIKKTH